MTVSAIPFTLGDALARARKGAGLDQQEVADACGVSRQLVSRWENGKSVPDVIQFHALARVTGAEWLLDLRLVGDLDTGTVGFPSGRPDQDFQGILPMSFQFALVA